MKKQILLVMLVVVGVALMASRQVQGNFGIGLGSIFMWESTTHDFGRIEQNLAKEHVFKFTNNGDVPLIISSVKASCGCTVAEYTKEPIAPGDKGSVSARYNAAKVGAFSKTVTVTANTGEEAVVLTLKGEVVTAE